MPPTTPTVGKTVNSKVDIRAALDKMNSRPLDYYSNLAKQRQSSIMTVKPTGTAIGTISGIHSQPAWSQNNTTGTISVNRTPNQYFSRPNNSCITLHGTNNAEIVRLNTNGTVTWADTIKIDEAADAFARSLNLGAELCAGITYSVKQQMRDAVFEELIDMATSKGSLTVDDLTYMHQAAKIMDKLKGIKE